MEFTHEEEYFMWFHISCFVSTYGNVKKASHTWMCVINMCNENFTCENLICVWTKQMTCENVQFTSDIVFMLKFLFTCEKILYMKICEIMIFTCERQISHSTFWWGVVVHVKITDSIRAVFIDYRSGPWLDTVCLCWVEGLNHLQNQCFHFPAQYMLHVTK